MVRLLRLAFVSPSSLYSPSACPPFTLACSTHPAAILKINNSSLLSTAFPWCDPQGPFLPQKSLYVPEFSWTVFYQRRQALQPHLLSDAVEMCYSFKWTSLQKFSEKKFIIQRSICDYTDSTNSLLCWSGDALGRRLSVCLSSLLPAAISFADIGMSWVQISGKAGSYLRKKFHCSWKGWDWKTCSLSAKYPDPWKVVYLLFF